MEMEAARAGEWMVPLDGYATVSEEDTLFEAVTLLKESGNRARFDGDRILLVRGTGGGIVGKIDFRDILMGIEPRYGQSNGPGESAVNKGYVRSAITIYDSREHPLEDLCRKAAEMKVGDILNAIGEIDRIEEDRTIEEAIRRLIGGGLQSLLVTRGDSVVGILRLSSIFDGFCAMIKACRC